MLPSSDHYNIERVSPSGDHCFTETVAPSSDNYCIGVVVPSSDQIEVAEELHAHSHAARLVCKQQQTAALEGQHDRRASLHQNGTGGG